MLLAENKYKYYFNFTIFLFELFFVGCFANPCEFLLGILPIASFNLLVFLIESDPCFFSFA